MGCQQANGYEELYLMLEYKCQIAIVVIRKNKSVLILKVDIVC